MTRGTNDLKRYGFQPHRIIQIIHQVVFSVDLCGLMLLLSHRHNDNYSKQAHFNAGF